MSDLKVERRREALNVVRNLVGTDAAPLDRSQLGTALVSYLQGSCDEDFVTFLVRERLLSDDTAVEIRGHTATWEPAAASSYAETLRTLGLDAGVASLSGAVTLVDTEGLGVRVEERSVHVVGRDSVLLTSGTFADRIRPLSEDHTETATHFAPRPRERYQSKRLLGLGGMGEVYEVADVDLNRPVALKRIRPDRNDPEMLARFLLEAQVTAQLEHPHIVPVHDFGRLSDGAPYFIMKRVEGTTLRDVIRKLSAGDEETVRRYSVTRLAIVFLHVVEAVAYAHARGVVHCDLKPENILLGRHGEVLVSDWGMAQLVGARSPREEDPVSLSPGTRAVPSGGGTLLYMAPEQVTGQRVDERTDVYALGAVLYEMLTLRTPHDARDHGELLVKIFSEDIVPPRERARDRDVPEELDAICQKALEPRAADRFARADEVRDAVEAYLTGARRRETARERFAEGEAAYARYRALDAERGQLEVERDRLAAEVKPYDGEAKKRPLWTVEERLYALDIAVEEALAEALDGWSQAVGIDSGYSDAADRLADAHLALFLEAESQGDRRQMVFHRRQVERHHRGRHMSVLAGKGSVTLVPESADVLIELRRLEERGKRIVPGERLVVDAHRIEELSLPMGSYLFTLRAPGRRECCIPVLVGRGSRAELRPRLLDEDRVHPDFIHVPASTFVYGGDKDALNAGPREERFVEDFLIARHPVTCEEYAAFLNDLAAEGPHLAERHVPRTKPDGGYLWSPDAQGRYAPPKIDADGNPGHPRAPVMGVSWIDAQAYASWRSTRDGRPYRLPREVEWEKAARGADGRFFPWGNGFDATFCKMALSRPGRPQPEPVGAFPVDTSVYGVQDCAGAIREWCADFYDDTQETRVLRGGAWYFNPSYCRVCFRHGYMPHIVFTNFGIRLAMSV